MATFSKTGNGTLTPDGPSPTPCHGLERGAQTQPLSPLNGSLCTVHILSNRMQYPCAQAPTCLQLIFTGGVVGRECLTE